MLKVRIPPPVCFRSNPEAKVAERCHEDWRGDTIPSGFSVFSDYCGRIAKFKRHPELIKTIQTSKFTRHLTIGATIALALLGRGPDAHTAMRVCVESGEPSVASIPAIAVRLMDASLAVCTESVVRDEGEGVFADGGIDAGGVTGPLSGELVLKLRELRPLRKVHYSWPLPNELFDLSDDPRLVEYVRISHAASVSGEWC